MVEEAKESYTFASALQEKYTETYEPKLFNNILLSPKRRGKFRDFAEKWLKVLLLHTLQLPDVI